VLLLILDVYHFIAVLAFSYVAAAVGLMKVDTIHWE